jgi:hypothetical protein
MLFTHPCRVAVIGSRTYWNLKTVRDFVAQLPQGCTVGGARGVDQTAEQAARAQGIPVQTYPADWSKFGKSAGIRRNHDMNRRMSSLPSGTDPAPALPTASSLPNQ